MRYRYTLLLLLSGCSISQENGNGFQIQPPPALREQNWAVTQQAAQGGVRSCTVAAGELQVTQRSQGRLSEVQIAPSIHLAPGEWYAVTVGPNHFETRDASFNASDSRKLAAVMQQGGKAYTEWHLPQIQWFHAAQTESRNNTLSLDDFPAAYQQCTRFIRGRRG